MNRLQLELDRLYGLDDGLDANAAAQAAAGPRALVLELALPAGWAQLSAAWQGVQADLDLPAPAIAVSGDDGLQLWFSFASPLSSGVGARFLERLRARYLPEVAPARVRLFADAAALPAAPFAETGPERWSAFVTPDLAAVFGDTPWLDLPPTDDGQAAILRALESIRPAAFDAASALLDAVEADAASPSGTPELPAPPAASAADAAIVPAIDPAGFLSRVMNDETAPLALRVDAAKALLAHAKRP